MLFHVTSRTALDGTRWFGAAGRDEKADQHAALTKKTHARLLCLTCMLTINNVVDTRVCRGGGGVVERWQTADSSRRRRRRRERSPRTKKRAHPSGRQSRSGIIRHGGCTWALFPFRFPFYFHLVPLGKPRASKWSRGQTRQKFSDAGHIIIYGHVD